MVKGQEGLPWVAGGPCVQSDIAGQSFRPKNTACFFRINISSKIRNTATRNKNFCPKQLRQRQKDDRRKEAVGVCGGNGLSASTRKR